MTWTSDWDYRKKITIHKSTYYTTETQTDFPVLIKHTDADIKAHAQSSGSDICFADESGSTQLDHEIELWDDSSGSLISWVKIPSLPSDEDLDIYVYYGNPASGNQENISGTWDDYNVVWHMNDYTTSQINDSLGNNNLTKLAANRPQEVLCLVGKGQDFSNSNDWAYCALPSPFNSAYMETCLWFKYTTGAYHQIFINGRSSVTGRGAAIIGEYYNISGLPPGNYLNFVDGAGTNLDGIYTDSSPYSDNEWHHLVTQRNNTKLLMYIDGVLIEEKDRTPFNYSAIQCEIGRRIGQNDRFYTGLMDEVRLTTTIHSADWVKTEYNSINYGYCTSVVSDGFFTLGTEEEISEPTEPTKVLLEDGVSLTDSVFYKHLISLTDDVSIATDLVTIKDIIHYQAESQVSIFDSYDLSHAYNVYENPALTDLLYAKHLITFDDTIDVLDVFYAKHLITYLDTVPVQDVGWKLNYIQSEIFNIASKIYVNTVVQERFGAQFTIKGVAYNLKLPVPLWNSADSSLNNNVKVLNLWSKDIRALDTGLGDEQTVLLGIWEISNPAEFSEDMELLFTLQDESAPITIDDLSDTLDGVYILAQISITTIPRVTGAYQYKIVLQKVRNIYE